MGPNSANALRVAVVEEVRQFLSCAVQEHPDMTSASEGGHSKGGCANCVVKINFKCGQEGEGVKKSKHCADVISGSPYQKS